jgi:hypothetical protein
MSEQEDLSPAERELEAALRSLAPAAARIDSVGAAFAAGQRSMRRQIRTWQSAAAAILLVSTGAWLVPFQRGMMTSRDVGDSAPVAEATNDALPRSEQSLLMLRQAVWKKGIDGLPAMPLPTAAPIRVNEIISTQRGES